MKTSSVDNVFLSTHPASRPFHTCALSTWLERLTCVCILHAYTEFVDAAFDFTPSGRRHFVASFSQRELQLALIRVMDTAYRFVAHVMRVHLNLGCTVLLHAACCGVSSHVVSCQPRRISAFAPVCCIASIVCVHHAFESGLYQHFFARAHAGVRVRSLSRCNALVSPSLCSPRAH